MIYYNSKEQHHKKPFGAILCGQKVQFAIDVSGAQEAREAYLVMAADGEEPVYISFDQKELWPGGDMDSQWNQRFCFSWQGPFTGLFFYSFKVVYADWSNEISEQFSLTVYEREGESPGLLHEGLMYQIFPDRFARPQNFDWERENRRYGESRQGMDYSLHKQWGEKPICGPDETGTVWNKDFFGGSLSGIMEQLDYLAELGVTVIYFNPIFQAFSNHRYDTGDYRTIDPLLGTEADFQRLCDLAGIRGIRIIIDGVFNHTGCHSLYFNKYGGYPGIGAYQSKESPYYNWYCFSEHPHKYDSWWGIDTLPSVNETEESYLNYILRDEDSVIKHWLRAGAAGVRIDVADELPDLFLDELRLAVKSVKPEAAIIGEVWEDASTKIAYGQRRRYFQGRQLDSVMNYPLKDGILAYIGGNGDAEIFGDMVESLWENYPREVFYSLMNILGTHDTERIFTVFYNSCGSLPEEERQNCAAAKLFLAVLIWAFMPGIPCVYYGDEIGMEGGRDPENRRCFELEKANKKIQAYYQEILAFRRKLPALVGAEAEFCPLVAKGTVYAFARVAETGRILVAVNGWADESQTCGNGEVEFLALHLELGESMADAVCVGGAAVKEGGIHLPPGSGIVAHIARK